MSHKISESLNQVRSFLPNSVSLVAVSKYHTIEEIREAYDAGQRIFGESRVQELLIKYEALPKDIEWHFIGHLQTNKVKFIAPFISMIHSVDSERLLSEINKQANIAGRNISCLLQLHVAQEETKFGFSPDECVEFVKQGHWKEMSNVLLKGLMCMASNVDNEQQIANEFDMALRCFEQIKSVSFAENEEFKECSWGMSGDFEIAVKHGSTMVRVGSRIFGAPHH